MCLGNETKGRAGCTTQLGLQAATGRSLFEFFVRKTRSYEHWQFRGNSDSEDPNPVSEIYSGNRPNVHKYLLLFVGAFEQHCFSQQKGTRHKIDTLYLKRVWNKWK